MFIMKNILLTILFLMFVACASQKAEAVEVDFTSGSDAQSVTALGDNGKCIDEITEYDRLLGITSASDEDKASALTKRDLALSLRLTGRIEECETLMQEANDLID
jgi:hypothetical protein